MAGSYLYKEQEDRYDYIENVFDTLILRDISQKYRIKNPALLNRIAEFMMDNTTNDKFYLSDHTFRYAKLGTKNLDNGRIIENIVAMELLRRGYEVYIGVLYKKEIDFVAIKRSEKIYIQVSDNITAPETFKREVNSLLKIKDAYPKMLIARTRNPEYQYEGIRVVDVADWILNK